MANIYEIIDQRHRTKLYSTLLSVIIGVTNLDLKVHALSGNGIWIAAEFSPMRLQRGVQQPFTTALNFQIATNLISAGTKGRCTVLVETSFESITL